MKLSILGLAAGLLILSSSVFAAQNIKFATEATYKPIVYMNTQGDVIGYEAELVQAICAQMPDYECELVNQPWDSLIPALNIGRFNALFGGMEITPERAAVVAFTEPLYAPQASFAVVDAQDIDDLYAQGELTVGRVGVQQGTTFEQFVKAHQGRSSINSYATIQDALLDLNTGRVDAVFGDDMVIADWIKDRRDERYQLIDFSIDEREASQTPIFGYGIGIAVQKDNEDLLNALNEGLAKIKENGVYDEIYQKYH